MTSSLSRKVGIAALIMMASVLLSRVIGLARVMVIASLGGATGEVDAYQVAFTLPEILNHAAASGFLSVTFIPIFTAYLADQKDEEGWRVCNVILTAIGVPFAALLVLAVWLAPQLVPMVAPGMSDPALLASAVRMTRIIIPAQFFFFIGSMLMAVQFAHERFLIPALAPLLYNLGIIAGGVALHRWLGMAGFAWGVLAGAFIGNFAVQYFGARRVGFRYRVVFDFRHRDLKKYLLLTLPLMVGLTMTFSIEFFSRFFGSYLSAGSIAALDYALRTMLILVGVFGQAAGVASFPFLARLQAEGRMAEMNALLNDTLRRYIALVIPIAVLLMLLSREVITILYQRGQFDALATERTAGVLIWLLAGAFGFAAQTVVVRGYYAVQNTLLPTVLVSIIVALSLPLYWLGVQWFDLNGLAATLSASVVVQSLVLYFWWNRRTGNRGREVYRHFLKVMLVSAIAGAVCLGLQRYVQASLPDTFTGSLLSCVLVGVPYLALFIALGHLLGIKEIAAILRRFRHRSKRRDAAEF